MGLLYGARLGLLGLATITAIIAFGLSIHTNIAGNNLNSFLKGAFNDVFEGSLSFAQLGIAAGVFTLIVVPFLLLADRPKLSPIRPLILLEVPIVSLLWILWLSAGGATASFSTANQNPYIDGVSRCDYFRDLRDVTTICNDSKPTVIFDIATGVILLVYTAALVLVAAKKSYGGRSIWSMTVKESED